MQTYLDIRNLTKSVGARLLFKGISFSVGKGQHVGLIANNGTGKSTLLNIIAGKDGYDEGEIVFRNDIRVGYLPQTPSYPPGLSVLDACFYDAAEISQLFFRFDKTLTDQSDTEIISRLFDEMDSKEAWDFEQKSKQILSKLNIHDFQQPVNLLSGGQLKRVALANVLLKDADLLILDEPTNHLDLEMTEWLENFLKRSNKSILMVTHDRYLLDHVCSQILELDDQKLYPYRGSYSYFVEKRLERISAANQLFARTQNLYRKELDWMRRTPSARSGKARFRKEAFYDLQEQVKQTKETKFSQIDIKSTYIGSKIFEAQYISKSFSQADDTPITILKNFYYNFSRYEKLGIIGKNGTGKTTFLRLLLGQEEPDSGQIVVGETVRFGYYSQEGIAFDNDQKVIDAVQKYAEIIHLKDGRTLTAMQMLTHFLFPPQRQQDYIYKLSGGERRRLYLCTVLMQNPNFLILDEPTNDLDIQTLQVLEEYLKNFSGCVIVVSHDRYFMDKIVDHLLVFKGNGEVKDYPGNYTQYRAYEKELKDVENENTVKARSNKPEEKRKSGNTVLGTRRLTYKEKKELEQIEQDLQRLESEKKQLEQELNSGALSIEALKEKSIRFPLLEEEISEKEMRWLELDEIRNN